MKIGVVGPLSTTSVIKEVVEQEFPNIELLIRSTKFFEDSARMAKELQELPDIDCLLFTGPSNYRYALSRVKPTLPWSFLAHNRVSLFMALLEANFTYHKEFKHISLDTYNEKLLHEVLSGIQVKGYTVSKSNYSVNESNLENKYYLFHKENYQKHSNTLCLTSVEHVQPPLVKEGIPCVRILPSKEIIMGQIYQLQISVLEKELDDQDKFAVIGIMTNYNYDDSNLEIRELEKMHYSHTLMSQIYYTAQKLSAGVFRDEFIHYFIVTTRDKLMNIFIKEGYYTKLLNFNQPGSQARVWLGIGVGKNSLEAKARAAMALNKTYHVNDTTQAILVEDEQNSTSLAPEQAQTTAEHRRSILASQCGLSSATLDKVAQCFSSYNHPLTAEQLAQDMGITVRSVNRIIAKLEEAELVHIIGKKSEGKGRPTRLLSLSLPQG